MNVIDRCPITGYGVLCTPEECEKNSDCEAKQRAEYERLKERIKELEQENTKLQRMVDTAIKHIRCAFKGAPQCKDLDCYTCLREALENEVEEEMKKEASSDGRA